MHERLGNYIDFIHERQPDDEQTLMFRPMPGGQVWKLKFEERFLQRLPFSNRQIRKTYVSTEKGIPPQLDPTHTELCFSCRKYRSVTQFEVFHEPNSAYVWYDKTCNFCKDAGSRLNVGDQERTKPPHTPVGRFCYGPRGVEPARSEGS